MIMLMRILGSTRSATTLRRLQALQLTFLTPLPKLAPLLVLLLRPLLQQLRLQKQLLQTPRLPRRKDPRQVSLQLRKQLPQRLRPRMLRSSLRSRRKRRQMRLQAEWQPSKTPEKGRRRFQLRRPLRQMMERLVIRMPTQAKLLPLTPLQLRQLSLLLRRLHWMRLRVISLHQGQHRQRQRRSLHRRRNSKTINCRLMHQVRGTVTTTEEMMALKTKHLKSSSLMILPATQALRRA
mmetsp:Transcript_116188/g.217507  ORF Transcript_116188/g.217507 Transcript_116188/m.217507 type:complete len:236 (-) Transcript_116188:414-1121(-)